MGREQPERYKVRRAGDGAGAAAPSVAAAEQGVVLGGVPAADAPRPGRQRAQGLEGDAEALGSHGRGAGLDVLIPGIKTQHSGSALAARAHPPRHAGLPLAVRTWRWSS